MKTIKRLQILFSWLDTFLRPEKLKVLEEGDPTEKISLAAADVGVGVGGVTLLTLAATQSKVKSAKADLDWESFPASLVAVVGPGPWLGLLLVFTPENLNPGEEREPTFFTATVFAFSEFSASELKGFVAAASILPPVEDPKIFLVLRGVNENGPI